MTAAMPHDQYLSAPQPAARPATTAPWYRRTWVIVLGAIVAGLVLFSAGFATGAVLSNLNRPAMGQNGFGPGQAGFPGQDGESPDGGQGGFGPGQGGQPPQGGPSSDQGDAESGTTGGDGSSS